MVQLDELSRLFDYGGTWYLKPEQEKQILTTLLQEFILYADGKIELRFKLPVNEKQVADTISTLSSDNVLYHGLKLDCPAIGW